MSLIAHNMSKLQCFSFSSYKNGNGTTSQIFVKEDQGSLVDCVPNVHKILDFHVIDE